MKKNTKFCEDCKHCYGWLPYCDRVKVNPATKEREHGCITERCLPWLFAVIMGMCGVSGRFFEKE
jgi:hypothetical protein